MIRVDTLHPSQEIFSHFGMFPGHNMSCTRTQHGASRETQTNDPFISGRALYHWLALQVLYSYSVTVSPRGMRCPSLM